LPPARIIADFQQGALRPLGHGIALSEQTLRDSTIVGQMGVHPIISALNAGAQYVIAGRACDSSIFAADMIRRGISPGLAYHVGHVLAGGAIACEPASPSDCLVAEIFDDQSALFVAPNLQRRCTVQSIAAHALYDEPHPQLQFYPEGVLTTANTQYHARDSRVAGISGSRLVRGETRWSIKLEGSRRLGHRRISLLYVDAAGVDKIPPDLLVYGRDAVQFLPIRDPSHEMGILIETTAATQESAVLLGNALRAHLARFSYPGRKGASGNIAFPLSPFGIAFRRSNGSFGYLIPCGTADPIFFKLLRRIEAAIIESLQIESPHAFAYASHAIQTIDATNPLVLVRTIDTDIDRLAERHAADIARVSTQAELRPGSRLNLDALDAYEWSVFHVLHNERLILDELFPITHFEANGGVWTQSTVQRPDYAEIAESESDGSVDPANLAVIDDVEPQGAALGTQRLADMAAVIRTKNAGINLLTFDLLFNSAESYEAALGSNAFCRANIAKVLGLSPKRIVASYFVDACNAIKITIHRPLVAAGPLERDLFGEQQQTALESLSIPIYASTLALPSSF
jgi:hypothetical protein